MRLKQPNWTRILTILLVILAAYAILYLGATALFRFTHAILLFVLGAMTAYILSPLVNRLERAFHFRWLAIVLSYLLIAVALFTLGVVLVTPFIQQAQSLVDNLHNPSASSLESIKSTQTDTGRLALELKCFQQAHPSGQCFDYRNQRQRLPDRIRADIQRVSTDLGNVRKGTVSGPSHAVEKPSKPSANRLPPNPPPQTQVPPSYIDKVEMAVTQLKTHYNDATQGSALIVDSYSLGKAVSDGTRAAGASTEMYHIMSTTPILLIRSQTWLDNHSVHVDLHSKFGQAASQLSNQGTIILDNSITILSETLNILLNTTLILIISFYLLLDGRRLIHGGLALVPARFREQVWFFVGSVDRVIGGYLRGQIIVSTLAGIMGGGGAALLGVPYPLLIGIMTFILDTVPVIGPLVVFLPPLAISLFFMPLPVTIELIVWFIVFQQVVTNFLGPRIMGRAVGVHPLEALLAVLIGYPLAGFLGGFLAVPLMGVIHILIREAYGYFVLGQAAPAATVPVEVEASDIPPPQPLPTRPKSDSAAG